MTLALFFTIGLLACDDKSTKDDVGSVNSLGDVPPSDSMVGCDENLRCSPDSRMLLANEKRIG